MKTLFILLLISFALCACPQNAVSHKTFSIEEGADSLSGVGVHATSNFICKVEDRPWQENDKEFTIILKDRQDKMIWTRRLRSDKTALVNAIRVSEQGDVYVAGIFQRFLQYDDKIVESQINAFLIAFDVHGDVKFTLFGKSKAMDSFQDIALDEVQNIYVAGQFAYETTIGDIKFKGSPYINGLVFKLSALDGSVVWAKSFGSKKCYTTTSQVLVHQEVVYTSFIATCNITFSPEFTLSFPADVSQLPALVQYNSNTGSFLQADLYHPIGARNAATSNVIIQDNSLVMSIVPFSSAFLQMPVYNIISPTWSLVLTNLSSLALDQQGSFVGIASGTDIQLGLLKLDVPENSFLTGTIKDGKVHNLQVHPNKKTKTVNELSCVNGDCYFVGNQLDLGRIENKCFECPANSYVKNNQCVTCPAHFIVEKGRCMQDVSSAAKVSGYWSILVIMLLVLLV